MIYLETKYEDRNMVQQLGAKWDTNVKKWFITDALDKNLFSRWLPKGIYIKIAPPIFIAKSFDICWRCGKVCDVIALSTRNLIDSDSFDDFNVFIKYNFDNYETSCNDIFNIQDILTLPDEFFTYFKNHFPFFRYTRTKTKGYSYFGNTCQQCEAPFGEHYMFSEPGGAFCPTSSDANDITFIRTPFSEKQYILIASFGMSFDAPLFI